MLSPSLGSTLQSGSFLTSEPCLQGECETICRVSVKPFGG